MAGPVAPDVYITGNLNTIVSYPTGTEPTQGQREFGSVKISLRGYGSITPRVGGEALLARVSAQSVLANGSTAPDPGGFGVWLYSNGLIDPAGTFYEISTLDDNGDTVQTEAYYFEPGSWDLSNMQPYDPGQPPPPLPPLIIPQLLVVPFSATPDFDGANFTSWQIILNGDVTSATLTNIIQGNLYTFIIIQDSTGNHAFGWPPNAYNASPVCPTPNSYTIQTFVAESDGSLYAIGAGTWYLL
jgi:hypothetical protein